jgi:uncharacterized protein (DUF1501 family)
MPRTPADPLGLFDRRRALHAGLLAGLGVTAPFGFAAAPAKRRAKAVIVLFAGGGQSQLELWDPKPDAPAEIRGAFGSIATAVPGIRFGEHLPEIARRAGMFTVVRSVTHDDLDHGSACYYALTGHMHPKKSSNPPPKPTDFPALGAALQRVRPAASFPYTAVHVNGPLLVPIEVGPGQNGGFLGRTADPLVLGDVTGGAALLDSLGPRPELPGERLADRRGLRDALDGGAATAGWNGLYRQAYALLAEPRCRDAFDLEREPTRLRDRYGRHRTGQACLLARRLVEAGVPLVTAFLNHTIRGQDASTDTDLFGWDTHNDIFEALREKLLPRFDQAFPALLDDLEQRGLLDDVLVVCMGEFGRAPRVARERNFAGTSPGRKHWAACYSLVLAGAGVARGGVYGASDRIAAYPQDRPVTPADVAATIYAALGLSPDAEYHDASGRPYPLSTGRPITGVYG